MPNLVRLRFLLEHIHSFDSCSQVLAETAKLFSVVPEGWFFNLLNKTIQSVIDDPDMFTADKMEKSQAARRDRPDFTCFQAGSETAAIARGVAAELGTLKDTQGKPEVGPFAPKK
jgi:hypothetical protein